MQYVYHLGSCQVGISLNWGASLCICILPPEHDDWAVHWKLLVFPVSCCTMLSEEALRMSTVKSIIICRLRRLKSEFGNQRHFLKKRQSLEHSSLPFPGPRTHTCSLKRAPGHPSRHSAGKSALEVFVSSLLNVHPDHKECGHGYTNREIQQHFVAASLELMPKQLR